MKLKKASNVRLIPPLIDECRIAMQKVSSKECGIDFCRNAERNYVSVLKCKICSKRFCSSLISSEIQKSLRDEIANKLYEVGYKSSNYFPDLVFHENHNQQDLDPQKQHLICEVKTSKYIDNKAFCRDFIKLNCFLDGLNYKAAAYILVRSHKSLIEKRLKFYVEKGLFQSGRMNHDIYFLIQQDFGKEVEIYTIDDSE